jgi:hypothetical protein
MEILVYLVHFILSLDVRWLRPLRVWVPDYQQILRAPSEELRQRDIVIGPWTHYVKIYVIPLLLFLPLLGLVAAFESLTITICLAVGWLLFSKIMAYIGRGGTCIIQADGVEFCFRGVVVFCPWDVFHAAGQPSYNPANQRLDLPVNPAALARIEAWKDDQPLDENWPSQVSHFVLAPTGEVRLKWVYRVLPIELGSFLLELGRRLGRPAEVGGLEGVGRETLRALPGEGGWISFSLTRLQFPPICCACCLATDSQQQFIGYRSLFSSDMSSSTQHIIITAPVCSACQKLNRGQYWRSLLKVAALTLVGLTFVCFAVGVILDLCGLTPGPGVMTGIMTVVGLILGLAFSWFVADHYARRASEPLSLQDYRPTDGTIRVRFRNRQYVETYLM